MTKVNPIQIYDHKTDYPGMDFLFAGDLVLSGELKHFSFDDSLSNLIYNSDFACVNLEAPLRSGSSIEKNGPALTTSEETPEILSDNGFDLACLANNHIMDYGYRGVEKTVDACSEAGIATVGTGETKTEAIEPYIRTQNGYQLAIYNVCQHEFGIASTTSPGTAWIDTPGLIRSIMTTSSEVDFVFVAVHGGNENVPLPSIRWQERLRELVDAGADAVVAHHPHVPQGWEVYEDCPIFYSLGNFVFDQTKYDANQWGYCVEFTIYGKEIKNVNVILTERVDQRVYMMGENRSIEKHSEYLQHVSKITEDSPINPGYWQEIASRKYKSKYKKFFRRLGSGDPISFYKNPANEIKRSVNLVLNRGQISSGKRLRLLNYIRAEAHREAIIAGLEVETGTVGDYRTPQIQSEIDDLYECLYDGVK